MQISKKLASQIVIAISEVVKSDINLINSSGMIIGSTDEKRIGTFHAAGYQAVHTGLPVTVDGRHPFAGAKAGINYPIILAGSPLAAIGITGCPDDLEQFGFLITKITEVFLKEQQLNEEMLSESRLLHYLITSLIYDNMQNPKQVEDLLIKYQINPADEFAVLSIKLIDPHLEKTLRFFFSNIGCRLSLYLYPNEWVVIFDQGCFQAFCSQQFITTFEGKLAAGLGPFGTLYQISQSYNHALIARKHAQKLQMTFCSSEQISIAFVLESLPGDIQNLYAKQTLQMLTEKDLLLLQTYFTNNLSLKDTATALYIHKNTLQYQLDRITEKSGKNPRNFQDAFLLQLALLFTGKETQPNCHM